jgi:hypothetical protein
VPKLIWSVLCRHGIIEAETNKISLVDIPEALYLPPDAISDIESLEPPDKVAVPIRWDHVTWWRRGNPDEPEAFIVRHTIRDPKGRMLAKGDLKVDFRGRSKARTLLRSGAMYLRGIGTYEFAVSVSIDGKRWRKVASIPFDVEPKPVATPDSERVAPIVWGDVELVKNG